MNNMISISDFFNHILAAIERIRHYTSNIQEVGLLNSDLVQNVLGFVTLPAWIWIVPNVMIFGSVIGILVVRVRYIRSLSTRISARANQIQWRVSNRDNSLAVGSISDKEYAKIQHLVYSDWRVYKLQLSNSARVFFNLLKLLFVAIPRILFWLGLAVFIYSPVSITELLSSLAIVSMYSVHYVVFWTIIICSAILSTWVVFIFVYKPSIFEFVNCFRDAIHAAVRSHCGIAAECRILVSRAVA